MQDDRLKICEKDKIRIRDLIVTALGGIPIETLQRLTEQAMDLPGYSRDSTITDQAFRDALSSIVREAAAEWAKENKASIHAAVMVALNGREQEILDNITDNVNGFLLNLDFSLSVSKKR